jgi:hypothetical protein
MCRTKYAQEEAADFEFNETAKYEYVKLFVKNVQVGGSAIKLKCGYGVYKAFHNVLRDYKPV